MSIGNKEVFARNLKRCINKSGKDRIDFDRPPNVKITNENKHEYGYEKLSRKDMFHTPPYKISIKLKY